MPWRMLFVLGLLLAAAGPCFAADNQVSVFISQSGADAIGQRSAALLKRLIQASPEYKLAPSHEAMMRVSIASIGLDAGKATNLRSTVSTVITMRNYLSYDPVEPQTWYPIFLAANLAVISADGAHKLAAELLARIGAELERYRQDVRKYGKAVLDGPGPKPLAHSSTPPVIEP